MATALEAPPVGLHLTLAPAQGKSPARQSIPDLQHHPGGREPASRDQNLIIREWQRIARERYTSTPLHGRRQAFTDGATPSIIMASNSAARWTWPMLFTPNAAIKNVCQRPT
eukprot:2276852-Pyramimonas_sp.AAC.1